MIDVKNVTKYWGKYKAVSDVSFHVAKGEIIGFLGHNGAGKTTLMRILTTYLLPSEGSVSVGGYDIRKNPMNIRSLIGYLPENPPLYLHMNVVDYLNFAGQLHGLAGNNLRKEVDRVLEECRLVQVKHQMIATLSKGFKQRVGLAQAIIHNPPVLILDEPTSGLDPIQVIHVRDLIQNFEEQRTVILSTHILPEIEQMAKRVLIIKKGSIIKDALMADLLQTPHSGKISLEQAFIQLHNDYE